MLTAEESRNGALATIGDNNDETSIREALRSGWADHDL